MTRAGDREAKLLLYLGMALLLVPSIARADVGIPMLLFAWPGAWIAFVPVVALETVIASRVIGLGFRASLKVAVVANLVSTLLGIPITWCCLLLVELLAAEVGSSFPSDGWTQAVLYPFFVAWLPPLERVGAHWMIVAAGIVLCVPFYFMSVWVEGLVARRFLSPDKYDLGKKWSWLANGASYGLITAALAAYLVFLRVAGSKE